jgi:hypothetical protein
MRLGLRHPGTSISFLDGPTGELILRIGSDEEGCMRVTFHLYDSEGHSIAESGDAAGFPEGVRVQAADGELLLDLPAEIGENICYHLYNRNGDLLTSSDGVSTRIGPCLRMESWPRGGTHHPPRQRPASTSVDSPTV